jgi:hypothetical protein
MPFVTGIGQPIEDGGPRSNAATAPPTGAAGLLRIDADQLDGAIGVFKTALDTVEHQIDVARNEISARPPANDPVSRDIARAFNRVSYQNSNSALAAWEGARDQLRSIVEQLEAAKHTSLNADQSNAKMLRSGE